MNLFDLQCKCCGGELAEVEGKSRVAKCIFCGKMQSIPELSDERRANQFNRAEQLRKNNDYDKAISVYEKLIEENPTDPEAYWSMVLCRYGVEYVKDPRSGEQKPTVNRAQYTSILADEDYKSAIKYANADQKELYEAEARQINEIQKGILDIASREEPFDIFICYKESDEHGKRTKDSILAQELYHELERDGYKVFFARVTLDGKLGSAYEPYIFSALNSAKVMVVIGTKPEYFNAVWVRNEWSRFLGLIKNGEKKMLIPAYKDMDAYDLPEEFAHLQALNMDKLGFMADLVMGIEKMLSFYRKDEKKEEPTPVFTAPTTPPPAPAKKKKSKAPIVIIALILVAAIAAGAFVISEKLGSATPETTVEQPPETTEENDGITTESEPSYIVIPGGESDETSEGDLLPPDDDTLGGDEIPVDTEEKPGGEGTPVDTEEKPGDEIPDEGGDENTIQDAQGVIYKLSADGSYYSVSGFVEGSVTVVKIPEFVESLVVMEIEAEAFKGCTAIVEMILPEGIATIGDSAFEGCSSLEKINFPGVLSSIGDNAFAGCDSLAEIRYDGNADEWATMDVGEGNEIFIYVKIEYNDDAVCKHENTYVDNCRVTCSDCGEKLEVRHEGGDYIDGNDNCIKKCSTCKEVLDYASQHSLYIDTDDNCNAKCSRCGHVEATGQHQSLTEERVEPTADTDGYVKKYCLDCGYVMSNQVLPATGSEPNPNLKVENAVKSIEEGTKYYGVLAQQNINKLLYLDGKMFNDWYLNTTEDIESAAFIYFESYGSDLYYMYFEVEGYKQYVNVYKTEDGKTDIELSDAPGECTWTFSEAYGCLVGLADEVLFLGTSNTGTYNNICTKQVDVMGDYFVLQLIKADDGAVDPSGEMFSYTLNYEKNGYIISGVWEAIKGTELNIPSEYNGLPVVEISDSGFMGLTQIKTLAIPGTVKTIGAEAFNGCTGITDVTISEGVEIIAQGAFRNCSSLSSVFIPKSVTHILETAFDSCNNIATVTYNGSESEWNALNKSGNDSLISAYITFVGGSAPMVETDGTFNYTLNSDKRSYSVSAVDGFKDTDLYIPDEYNGYPVTVIAENAFQGLSTVKNVTIPQSITTIGQNAFFNCTRITVIMIPEGVSSIGEAAFYRCMALQTIYIPTSVTTIGDNAFSNCTSLSSVYYSGSAAEWKEIIVGGNNDCLTNATFSYAGGAGSDDGSDDPVVGETVTVSSADELINTINKINNGTLAKNVTIELTQSIDMQGKTFTPIYDFRGVFDGKTYIISNVTLPSSGTVITVSDGNWAEYGINAIGFINTAYGATVKNLTLENVTANFTTASNIFVGALVGFADGLTVQDCTVISNLDVTAWHTGYSTISGVAGLVGYSLDASAERVNINTVVDYTANSGEAFTAAVLGAGNIRVDDSDILLQVSYIGKGGAGHTGSLIGMERTPDGVTLTSITNSAVTGEVTFNSNWDGDSSVIGQHIGTNLDENIINNSGNTINVTYNKIDS